MRDIESIVNALSWKVRVCVWKGRKCHSHFPRRSRVVIASADVVFLATVLLVKRSKSSYGIVCSVLRKHCTGAGLFQVIQITVLNILCLYW